MRIHFKRGTVTAFLLTFALAIAFGALLKVVVLDLMRSSVVSAQSTATNISGGTFMFHESAGKGSVVGQGDDARLMRRGKFATRTDGSIVEQFDVFNKEGAVLHSLREIDLANGLHIEVDDLTRTVTAVKRANFAQRRRAQQWLPESGCTQRADGSASKVPATILGHENIAGQNTTALRTETPTATMLSWRGSGTGCEDLRRVMFFKNHDGVITDWSEKVVETYVPGQPDQTLYSVPDEYERITYTQKYHREVNRFGVKPVPSELASLEKLDEQTKNIRYTGSMR